jgi:hypothetical protein
MPTKTIQKTVNANEPVRAPDQNWLAPATPNGKGRTTAQEDRIKAAYQKGADLDRLVSNYHARPEVIMRILELDPNEHAEAYAKMLEAYNDLRAGALR